MPDLACVGPIASHGAGGWEGEGGRGRRGGEGEGGGGDAPNVRGPYGGAGHGPSSQFAT